MCKGVKAHVFEIISLVGRLPKLVGGISPEFQLWCHWRQRRTDYILRSKGQGHDQIKCGQKHFVVIFSLQNIKLWQFELAWMCYGWFCYYV